MDFSIYDSQTRELLDEVYAVFGQFSAWMLSNMTYQSRLGKIPRLGIKHFLPQVFG